MRLLPVLLLLSLPQAIFSQPATAPAPVAAAAKGIFWKATSGKNTLHLLGSIHVGNKEMYPLAKEVEEAFDRSSVLFVEIDVKHADMMAMQRLVAEKGMYRDEDNLWNHVSPETRKKVEAFCDKYGFPAMMAGKMRPWMLSMFAVMLPLMKEGGMSAGQGIDMYFLEKQEKAKDRIRVQELETAEQQLEAFASFDGTMQETQLVMSLEQASADKLVQIKDQWVRGDEESLDKLINEMPPEVFKMLIVERNRKMADKAEAFLKAQDKDGKKAEGFFVVGAAHIVGKEGVVRMLEKRGFSIERVALTR